VFAFVLVLTTTHSPRNGSTTQQENARAIWLYNKRESLLAQGLQLPEALQEPIEEPYNRYSYYQYH
jgi:hypothetical protein